MADIKIFKIKQKFNGVQELYDYVMKNYKKISELSEIDMQKPRQKNPYFLSSYEMITERKVLIFASKSEFIESLGELILLAGAFNPEILIFFAEDLSLNHFDAFNWLHNICSNEITIIAAEAKF
jgi:hypothetical protein